MGQWNRIDLTGGVVVTRNESALGQGELKASSDARLKPGDLAQVHRDKTNQQLVSVSTVSAADYISWEGQSDQLLAMVTSGTSLLTLYNAASGSYTNSESLTGALTDFAAVHRGNEYFVGTSEANHVLSSGSGGTFRDMGMSGAFESGISSSARLAGGSNHDTPSATLGSGNYDVGDVVLYWYTEYDSTNDIESGPVFIRFWYTPASGWVAGDTPMIELPWSAASGYSAINSNTDQAKLYRAYLGDFGSAEQAFAKAGQLSLDMVRDGMAGFMNTLAGRGGLVEIMDWDYNSFNTTDYYTEGIDNTDMGVFDPPIQWPQVYINSGSVTAIYEKLRKAKPYDIGMLWNDSLVVNDPGTSKQIIRFSPPGQPEYQPVPYVLYFATEQSDEVVGLSQASGRLIVLLKGSVWRVNYLPFEGFVANLVGKVQESLSNDGCVARRAYQKIDVEGIGEAVVWVSQEGLRMTNGSEVVDPCPDWSVEGAGVGSIGSVVLQNNRALHRLELYDGTTRWDFYYHATLLKRGKFRCMGPTTMDYSVVDSAIGESGGVHKAYLAAASALYTQNSATGDAALVVETGQIQGPNPMASLEIEAVGLTHTVGDGSATVKLTSKYEREDESSESVTLTLAKDETTANDPAGGGFNGNWVRVQVSCGGTGALSVGPLWLKGEVMEDGDG